MNPTGHSLKSPSFSGESPPLAPSYSLFAALNLVVVVCIKIENMQSLKDIVPAARNNINTQFIVLEKGKITTEGGQNKACLGLVADETASVHFQFWNEECDAFQPGDILCLSNGIFSYQRKNLIVRAGKRGKVEKIGEFSMVFMESPNMSEILWVEKPKNSGKFVQQSVISPHSQIFPPMV